MFLTKTFHINFDLVEELSKFLFFVQRKIWENGEFKTWLNSSFAIKKENFKNFFVFERKFSSVFAACMNERFLLYEFNNFSYIHQQWKAFSAQKNPLVNSEWFTSCHPQLINNENFLRFLSPILFIKLLSTWIIFHCLGKWVGNFWSVERRFNGTKTFSSFIVGISF